MFDLGQLIFYMRDGKLHSAPVLARMSIQNLHPNWNANKSQRDLFQPFGPNSATYGTCHGLVGGEEAFASKRELAADLFNDPSMIEQYPVVNAD